MAEYDKLFLYVLKFKQMYIEFYICLNLLCRVRVMQFPGD